MRSFTFGPEAVNQIRKTVRDSEHNRRALGLEPKAQTYYFPVYIAKSPVGGIDARIGTTPGSASVDIFYINDSGTLTDSGENVTAYNIAANAIDASTYIQIKMDMFGKYIVDFEDC